MERLSFNSFGGLIMKPEKWEVTLRVTVKGKDIVAGRKICPTKTIAEIEAQRMERRQPAHLFPRASVYDLTGMES